MASAGSEIPTKAVRSTDPLMTMSELNSHHTVIYDGSEEISNDVIPATGLNQTNATFNLYPPSEHTVVDPRLFMEVKVRVTPTTATQDLYDDFQNAFFGPRAFPLASCMSTLTLKLNNAAFSTTPNIWISKFMRYMSHEDKRRLFTMTPNMPDTAQNYNDAFVAASKVAGTAAYPLLGAGTSNLYEKRGAHPFEVEGVAGVNQTLLYTFYEPLFSSPAVHENKSQVGWINLTHINVNVIWANLQNMFSLNQTLADSVHGAFLGFNVVIAETPQMHIRYLTPTSAQMKAQPTMAIYDYVSIVDNVSNPVSIANNASSVVTSAVLQTTSIPKSILIFASKVGFDPADTDSDAVITNLHITYNNKSSRLSELQLADLFTLSANNGCNQTWGEFSERQGNSIMVNFGKDLGLREDQSPGMSERLTVQARCTIKNVSGATKSYELHVVVNQLGAITIEPGLAHSAVGYYDSRLTTSQPVVEVPYHQAVGATGGSVWSDFKHGFSEGIAPFVSAGKAILPLLGAGTLGGSSAQNQAVAKKRGKSALRN